MQDRYPCIQDDINISISPLEVEDRDMASINQDNWILVTTRKASGITISGPCSRSVKNPNLLGGIVRPII